MMVFVDGMGLGDPDPATNLLVRAKTPTFHRLLGGPLAGREAVLAAEAVLVPLDAQLGVPGLLQGGTGQVAILTGENAPALVGRHVTAYPTQALRSLLMRQASGCQRSATLPAADRALSDGGPGLLHRGRHQSVLRPGSVHRPRGGGAARAQDTPCVYAHGQLVATHPRQAARYQRLVEPAHIAGLAGGPILNPPLLPAVPLPDVEVRDLAIYESLAGWTHDDPPARPD